MALKSSIVKKQSSTGDKDYIFNSIADMIIAVDQMGKITIFNKACEKVFGIPADKAKGRLVSEVIPFTGLIKVLKTGKAHIGRKFILGDSIYITNRTPIIKDNIIVGAIGVVQEKTELHHLAEELGKIGHQKDTMESIFDNTHEGYISINIEGHVNFINKAMAELLEEDAESILGRHITEIIPETKMHLIQINARLQHFELMRFRDKNVLFSCYPVIKNGKVDGVVSKFIYHDLDKRAIQLVPQNNKSPKSTSKSNGAYYSLNDIIGTSKAITELKEIVRRVAKGPSTVLITGESGTGKELFAHALHNHSPRRNEPFIKVNCAAVPENLMESELFGYREGAFTGARKGGQVGKFELAHGGTIFLDEIGDMTLAMQAKILRVLQEKEVERLGDINYKKIDVRVIAATNRDILKLIDQGQFRQDLYYRLNVVNLTIPPLSNRIDDIPVLVDHFINKFNRDFNFSVKSLDKEVARLFETYQWVGNIRELENIIERAFNLVEGDNINLEHLPDHLLLHRKKYKQKVSNKNLTDLLESVEREALLNALEETGGNKLKAAKLLGISRAWLYKKINQYEIQL